jgi:ABC-2 type transport system permease protein
VPVSEGRVAVSRLGEVVASRKILWLLVTRDLRLRYAGTLLGYLWTIIDPLAMAAVYWFVFTVIFQTRRIGEQPYILFLVVGMLAWSWFAGAISEGCRSLTGEAKIVRSSNLPREVWVARTVTSKMIEFLLALPVIVLFAVLFRQPVSFYVLLFPVAMVLQFMLIFGLVLMLAPLTVIVTDIPRLVKIVLRIGLYLTPVLYAVSNIPENLQWIAALNPLSGILSMYRLMFWPEATAPWTVYATSVVFSVVILALGFGVFRRLEGPVLKEI